MRHFYHHRSFGTDFPLPVPGLLVNIRAAYMIVLDDDGVCPLWRDEGLPARHKQSITAAPKETDYQFPPPSSAKGISQSGMHLAMEL